MVTTKDGQRNNCFPHSIVFLWHAGGQRYVLHKIWKICSEPMNKMDGMCTRLFQLTYKPRKRKYGYWKRSCWGGPEGQWWRVSENSIKKLQNWRNVGKRLHIYFPVYLLVSNHHSSNTWTSFIQKSYHLNCFICFLSNLSINPTLKNPCFFSLLWWHP